MTLSPEDFVKRLDDISESAGTPYGRTYLLLEEEQKHRECILQYKGYLALSDAFKCFFLETVELINHGYMHNVDAAPSEDYTFFVPRLTHDFKSLCGAERVAICGYPLHAYTILRNVFDNAILTAASLQRITDFYSIEGLVPGEDPDVLTTKKLRKKTEFYVRQKMT